MNICFHLLFCQIQRMVISGGNFKPDTLKPKEVVSLLLDDEEIEQKCNVLIEKKKKKQKIRLIIIALPLIIMFTLQIANEMMRKEDSHKKKICDWKLKKNENEKRLLLR